MSAPKAPALRAAIYARYSTDAQSEATLRDQFRVCTETAERNGHTVTTRFEDAAISGGATANRPGFLSMQEAAERRDFDVLYVMDMSRLSRNQGDLSKSVEWLVYCGVRVIGCHDGVDTARDGWEPQVGLSGVIGHQFRLMISKKTTEAMKTRAKEHRPTGGEPYGYDYKNQTRTINTVRAEIVRTIFARFNEGASCQTIAEELNDQKVPSPGSTRKRTILRCSGWAGSSVRIILRNPIYKGTVRWGTSHWKKNPRTGKRERREAPPSEWYEHQDESLRIVSDAVWKAAQARTRDASNPSLALKCGGKPRFLLSGLLECTACHAHYTMADATHYACGAYTDGRACRNGVRVKREHLQKVILGPINEHLLAPARIERMAKEMQAQLLAELKAARSRADSAPKEVQEIDARIARLRSRLAAGDPDLTSDEIQGAIDKAVAKRQALLDSQPAARASANVLKMLPSAAKLYREQIAAGLDGNAGEASKARVFLKRLFGGKIRLEPQKDGGLIAEYAMNRFALLAATGSYGSGGRI